MLEWLFRRSPLRVRFEQRECVIVPQTATHVALHADVFALVATNSEPCVIDDAYLLWESAPTGRQASVIRRSRWDRAVIDGRFRYPPQSLDFGANSEAKPITLTFNDGLIPHSGDPPPESYLVLELGLRGQKKAIRYRLWRVRMRSWEEPAEIEWISAEMG